jgi:hypothetical protein
VETKRNALEKKLPKMMHEFHQFKNAQVAKSKENIEIINIINLKMHWLQKVKKTLK